MEGVTSEKVVKMDQKEINHEDIVCEVCQKIKGKINEINWKRHTTACKDKEEKKAKKAKLKRKNEFGNQKMTKFLINKTARIGVDAGVTVSVSYGATVDVSGADVDLGDVGDVATIGDDVVPLGVEKNYDGEVSTDVKKNAEGGAINTIESNVSSIKCEGYKPNLCDIYRDLACHQLENLDIVIENRNLHHNSCAEKCYVVYNSTVNEACKSLQYSTSLKKILNRGNCVISQDETLITTNNESLSHKQLCDKVAYLQKDRRELRLKLMKSNFKTSKLCGTIALHERFMVLISDNNILRLQQLVKVALNNNRSVGHIVSKVMAVIDGLYRPNPSQDDKDLAFLTLKFGGPSLLNMLYRAGVLPSVSLAYKMSKSCHPLVSSVNSSVKDCFDNITVSVIGGSSMSLKLDETYITPVLSYNSKDNQVYGICYQHGCKEKLEMDEFADCEIIQNKIKNDELHVPKECLVAGLAPLNENSTMQPLLMWPTCSKKDGDGTIKLINDVNQQMKESTGFPLVNLSTDGDGTRRKAMHRLMDHDARVFDWSKHIVDLPLLDYVVGPDGITCNFDPKHMAKRCWRMVLSEKMLINDIVITKKLLKEFLEGNTIGVGENQLHPKDKQNVEAATNFLLAFIEMSEKEELPYNFIPIKIHLKCLGKIFQGLLSFYVYADTSIEDQIKNISTASYLLFYLYRKHKTALVPAQLYHDLMTSFIDALFCCAKGKEFTPDQPLYLVRDGSDLLERFFGNVRLRFKGSNYNVLEMINAGRAMSKCDKILMDDHKEWSQKSRVQRRLALDYSNAGSWCKEKLILSNVDIQVTWRSGYYKAMSMLPVSAVSELEDANTTLRCPLKLGTVVGVGVHDSADDSSMLEEPCNEPNEQTEENNYVSPGDQEDINLAEIIQDPSQKVEPFFMTDGKRIYKSSCLKAISSSQNLSKDRLRRVQGMTRYPGESSGPLSHEDSLIFIGDPLLVSQKTQGPLLANIVKMKKANQLLTEFDASKGLDGIEFTLRKIETKEIDGKLFWKGTAATDIFYCSGDICLPIKPDIDLNPPTDMSKFFFHMNQLREASVHLQLQPTSESNQIKQMTTNPTSNASNSSVLKKPCFICSKRLPLSDMLCHVGTHILQEHVKGASLCGFCGRDICVVTMKKTSKKGGKQYYGIGDCDCDYYYMYGKAKKFNKIKNPCTNRILRCPVGKCLSNVWIYNFQQHFNEKHENKDYPQEMLIDAAEVDFHKSKK